MWQLADPNNLTTVRYKYTCFSTLYKTLNENPFCEIEWKHWVTPNLFQERDQNILWGLKRERNIFFFEKVCKKFVNIFPVEAIGECVFLKNKYEKLQLILFGVTLEPDKTEMCFL